MRATGSPFRVWGGDQVSHEVGRRLSPGPPSRAQCRSASRLRSGEVGLKTTDERAPGLANGESSTAPAGGVVASVADAEPAGSSALVGSATVAYVTTTSPCSEYAVVAVIGASAACTNWSAAVTPAGVPGAHVAPAG